VILRLRPEILEDRLLPVPLHKIPVLNLPVSDWITNTISWSFCVGDGLLADEEVQILYSAF
jgi:hypothetical protein